MKSSLENLSISSFKKFDNSDLWPTSPDTVWCQGFFYFNYLSTEFSEIVRKQFTVAKFANHNFILVHISNSIGVIIPILVKKAN